MGSRLVVWLATVGAAVTVSCDRRHGVVGACPGVFASGLTNAADRPSLPLSPGQEAAIGALEGPDGEEVCTGTFIGDRFILTARHCLNRGPSSGLVFHTARDAIALMTLAAESYPHPELDAMLLRIPSSAAFDALGIEGVALWNATETRDWVQQTVTLAGLGLRTDGGRGRRQYLDETVVAASSDVIVVDGGPEHGACAGDSGGPLLATAVDKTVRVIGILATGSATCRGEDRYVPITAIADWIAGVRAGAARDPCAGVTAEGSCADGLARWCAGDQVQAERCDGGRLCGWHAGAQGYRCVPTEDDPCLGAGPEGICDGLVLQVCQQGTLVETDCAACGLACAREGNGRAACR